MLGGAGFTRRESSSGKFVSYTVEARMQCSGDVIDLYKAAAVVEGLIAL